MTGRGRYLKLFDDQGSFIICDEHDEPRVDAAVTAFLDSAGSRDRLLELSMVEGGAFKMRTSAVHSWFISTPENRRARMAIDQESEAEHVEMRRELGIWDAEE